jgi:hypothetical protein
MPAIAVDESSALALVQGRTAVAPATATGRYRCYGPAGRFLGIVDAAGESLRPVRLARTDAGDAD